MASSLPHLFPVQRAALDADTTPAYSTRNSEPAKGSAGIQVRPSGAAFQGRQFQRRENGVSEGMVPSYSIWVAISFPSGILPRHPQPPFYGGYVAFSGQTSTAGL